MRPSSSADEDDYVDWVMRGSPAGGYRPKTPRPPPGRLEGDWFDGATPLERHAYLTAHPRSRHAPKTPLPPGPKIDSREAFHRASAAFHRGAFVKFADRGDVDGRALAGAHRKARLAHAEAMEALGPVRAAPDNREARSAYEARLNAARAATSLVEKTHKMLHQPVGVGHTRYVSK